MKNQQLPNRLFPFIWYFLRDYKAATFAYIFLGLVAGLWAPVNSFLIKELIDLLPQIQNNNIKILFWPASWIVLSFIIFDNFTWRGIGYILYRYMGEVNNKITHNLLNHILSESHQFFQDNLSGKISKQISTLVENINIVLCGTAADLLRGTTLILSSLIASFYVNPVFCYILIIWLIFFASFSLYISKYLVSFADEYAKQDSNLSGQIVDVVSNHSNVRIFARKSFELERMKEYFSSLLQAYKSLEGFQVFLHGIQGGMIAIMRVFMVYFLIYLYQLGLVTIGDFALILGMSMNLGHMTWYTMMKVDDFNRAYGKAKQSLSALMSYPEITDKEDAGELSCKEGKIEFCNVGFHYKGTEPLFKDKNITIEPGQKVGLVGFSGGGKTTFTNLILRLYDVTGGKIMIDGQDIRSVTQDSLRENIAMIPQDPVLFHRSLMDNIRYSKINATGDEVKAAAKSAHAHDFIMQLPEGYASLVGERGVRLSGGQRQRIAIARAALKDAPILILDEATSQLDSVTEGLIQDSLQSLMNRKTTLVIAHRLSTLLNMDRILVFEKGQIVEDGTHEELLQKNGLYKTLWNAQIGGFLGDK